MSDFESLCTVRSFSIFVRCEIRVAILCICKVDVDSRRFLTAATIYVPFCGDDIFNKFGDRMAIRSSCSYGAFYARALWRLSCPYPLTCTCASYTWTTFLPSSILSYKIWKQTQMDSYVDLLAEYVHCICCFVGSCIEPSVKRVSLVVDKLLRCVIVLDI